MRCLDCGAVAEADDDFTERTISFRASRCCDRSPRSTAHLLLVHVENAPPRHVPLHLLPLTIGRSAPAELVLEGGTVSRRHCRLERQNDDIVLSDLGSTNGTFVNGERIVAPSRAGGRSTHHHRRARAQLSSPQPNRNWPAGRRWIANLARRATTCCRCCRRRSPAGPVQAEWFFQPCTRLGGDAFGYQMLDSRSFAAYMLDVAGHGAGIRAVLGDGRERAAPAHAAGGRFPRSRRGDPWFEPHVSDGAAQQPVLHHVVWRLRHSGPRGQLRHGRSPSGVSAASWCDAADSAWHAQSVDRHRRGSRRRRRTRSRWRQAVRCSCSATACSRSPTARAANGTCRRFCRCCR